MLLKIISKNYLKKPKYQINSREFIRNYNIFNLFISSKHFIKLFYSDYNQYMKLYS